MIQAGTLFMFVFALQIVCFYPSHSLLLLWFIFKHSNLTNVELFQFIETARWGYTCSIVAGVDG